MATHMLLLLCLYITCDMHEWRHADTPTFSLAWWHIHALLNVLSAVMTLLGKHDLDWGKIKKEMTDPKFFMKIVEFDKNNIPDRTL